MVMPEGISGVDLAERLLADRPDLKSHLHQRLHLRLKSAPNCSHGHRRSFLQKPYSHTMLARAVRDCLDRNRCESLTPHGNPRVRRHHRRHLERHSLRRNRRTRPRRRLRTARHRQSPAPLLVASLPAFHLDAKSVGSRSATRPFPERRSSRWIMSWPTEIIPATADLSA